MKPRMNKPATRLNADQVLFRVRRHAEAHGLLVVQRSRSALGPVLVIDERTGRLVDRNVPSLAALATKLGLVKPGETT